MNTAKRIITSKRMPALSLPILTTLTGTMKRMVGTKAVWGPSRKESSVPSGEFTYDHMQRLSPSSLNGIIK